MSVFQRVTATTPERTVCPVISRLDNVTAVLRSRDSRATSVNPTSTTTPSVKVQRPELFVYTIYHLTTQLHCLQRCNVLEHLDIQMLFNTLSCI